MAESWEEAGALGSASRVPTNEWFPVNTATGAWDLPGQPATLASSAGLPDVNAAPVWGGAPDQAPLAIGQVAGTMAPPMTIPASMQRVARADQAGLLTPQPSMWESIARGIGYASPLGRSYLQATDQQQQQQLQNRLTLRRQALQEQQNERTEIRDDFNTLVKLSEIKSKSLRKLYTDRFVADLQARGKALPPDFVEAFKNSTQDESKAMVQFYQPLLQDLGLDPTAFAELVDQGGIKEVGEALTLAQKLKKDRTEQARLDALDKIGSGSTLGDVSGVTQPTPAPAADQRPRGYVESGMPTTAAPSSGQEVIDTALSENARLYNVRLPLLHGIARHESNYTADAVSPKGATGVMQLMPGTAKEQGVENPKDPVQNVRGGTRYFAQLLTKYNGNEALALAAYNWGPGNVDKVGGDLTKMPAETQAYVKNVLASAASGQRGPAGTEGKVAGTGAPAPTATASPTDQPALQRLKDAIALKDRQIEAYTRVGGEEANRRADNAAKQRDVLQKQYDRLEDRLTETPRAVAKQAALQAGQKELAEAQRALTPIPETTQKSLAANKSIYRSIGKIEQYFREGTDLPEDFINQVAEDAPGIRAQLQADPKNATGILQQWETKLKAASKNDPSANRFLAALANMRDLIIRERSGGSVTGNELERAMGAFMGSLPNINQAFSLFVQNLANIKETVVDELVTAGSSARPLAGGRAVYGSLPKEVRDAIDAYERGEEPPKAMRAPAATTQPRPQVTGPIKQVAP